MKNKKMDQADSFDLRPASVEEAGLFHPDGETLVGRVTFASGERQEFTDHGAYLQTIWEELPYRNTTGLRHETLTDDPELKKAVDDILLDFAGEENPRRACNYGLTEAGKQALREAADPGRSHTYAWFVLTDCSTPEEQICRNLTLEEAIANNAAHASSFGYIMQYSMFKTFATKYRTSMRKIIRRLRIDKHFGVHFTDKKGKQKTRLFYKDGFARKPGQKSAMIDAIPNTVMYSSKTSLMDRLSARQCELCGRTDMDIEMHHVRKLKDLKGKSYWERFMIARNRKTLALCADCHKNLHNGKLN